MRKLILLSTLVLFGCSSHSDYEVVSLLDYATETELVKKGFTKENIDQINNESENKEWGRGYSRYEGYHKYKINSFDIFSQSQRS